MFGAVSYQKTRQVLISFNIANRKLASSYPSFGHKTTVLLARQLNVTMVFCYFNVFSWWGANRLWAILRPVSTFHGRFIWFYFGVSSCGFAWKWRSTSRRTVACLKLNTLHFWPNVYSNEFYCSKTLMIVWMHCMRLLSRSTCISQHRQSVHTSALFSLYQQIRNYLKRLWLCSYVFQLRPNNFSFLLGPLFT